MREVRLKEDGEAHVALRYGQVVKQHFISIVTGQFRMWWLLCLFLRRMQIVIRGTFGSPGTWYY